MAVVPDTDAVTIPGFSERRVRVKPGGEKAPAKSTGAEPSPKLSVTGRRAPATVGGAVAPCGTTRTVNVVSATPPAFRAVTVIWAAPALTGATSALPPSPTDTTATFVLDEVADHSLTTPEIADEKSTTTSGPRTVNSRSGSWFATLGAAIGVGAGAGGGGVGTVPESPHAHRYRAATSGTAARFPARASGATRRETVNRALRPRRIHFALGESTLRFPQRCGAVIWFLKCMSCVTWVTNNGPGMGCPPFTLPPRGRAFREGGTCWTGSGGQAGEN